MGNLLQIRKNLELMVIKKAQEDKEFEALMLKNPKAALKSLGVLLPDNISVEIIEEGGDVFKFVYPKSESEELNDLGLSLVAGGSPTTQFSSDLPPQS